MSPLWLIRASQLVRNPPPLGRVLLVLSVVALYVLLYAAETIWGWPDWLMTDRAPKSRVLR